MSKKKIIILSILTALFASLAFGIYYVNKIVLPTLVREKLITGLSELTSTKVTLDGLRFSLLRGIVITGLEISDKDDPSKLLCSIKDASAGFLLPALVTKKKVIIPSITINSLTLQLNRKKDGTLNISDLIEKLKKPQGPAKEPPVIIKSVKISDSVIHFTDFTIEPNTAAELDIERLSVNMQLQKATASTQCYIVKDSKKTGLKLKVDYYYASQGWEADMASDAIDLLVFKNYLKSIPVGIEAAEIHDLKTKISFDNKTINADGMLKIAPLSLKQNDVSLKDATGSVSFSIQSGTDDFKKMSAKGNIILEKGLFSYIGVAGIDGKIEKSSCEYIKTENSLNLSLNLALSSTNIVKDRTKIAGASVQTKTKLVIPLLPKEGMRDSINYTGTAVVRADEVSGLEQIGALYGISARVSFKNNEALIDQLQLKALDSEITGKGTLKNSTLSLDVEGDFDLEEIVKILPQGSELPEFDISGTTEAKINITTDIAKPQAPAVKGEALLQNVDLELPQNKISLETDSGRLKFDTSQEKLEWHFEAVKYSGSKYSVDGTLKNFKTPQIAAMVIGPDVKCHIELTKEPNLTKITSAKGNYKNSEFDMAATIDTAQNISASGTVNLNLADLIYFLPQNQSTFEQMKLSGNCTLQTKLKGPLSNWKLWNINTTGSSSLIKCYGLKFQNVALEYVQLQQQGFLNLLTFDSYRGKGILKGKLELLGKDISYNFQGSLRSLELGLLKNDTPLKEKNIYGLLDVDISGAGRAANLNTLRGEGAFTISEGNLWEFNPLGGLGSFIFKPGFNRTMFSNARADFIIRDGYVATDNLELLGENLGLIGEGRVYFDGNIDFIINTQIPASGAGKVGDIITRAGNITAVKISGTVKEPKYKLQPIGENIIKKVSDIFSNILP